MRQRADTLRPGRRRAVESGLLTWQCVAVGIGSFAILLLGMSRWLGVYDEGIILTDAMRVLHGDVTHRDFYSPYGPAQYYAVAALIRLFGDSFLAARCYDLAVRACCIALVYGILRTLTRPSLALVAAGLCLCWYLVTAFYLYPVFPCTLLALVASWLIARYGAEPSSARSLFVAGACCGLTALLRYDVGFFLLAANLAALLVLKGFAPHGGGKLRRLLAEIIAYGLGTALIFVPAALAFFAVSPLGPFLNDVFDYPINYYAAMRSLPLPGPITLLLQPDEIAVYLPPLAVGLAVLELRRRSARHAFGHAALNLVDASLIVFGLLTAALFLKGIVRVRVLHMLLSMVPATIVVGIVLERWWAPAVRWRKAAIAVGLFVGLAGLLSLGAYTAGFVYSPDRTFAGYLAARAGLMRAPSRSPCETAFGSGLPLLPPAEGWAARYVELHTAPGEPIFVAAGRHDRLLVNAVAIYFATGRMPGTNWHHFDPGLQTRTDIQERIIADLRRNDVRWVVRDASFDDMDEANASSLSSGVKLLDEYLAAHYRRVAARGKVDILLANDAPDPAPVAPDACLGSS